MAAAPALRRLLLLLALLAAGAIATVAPASGEAPAAPVTATVAGSVKKPPSAKRPQLAAKRGAKRPVKARPPRVTAAPAAPNDPLWSSSWSLAKTHASAAWKLTAGGPETVVAVLDTGVDLTHPDLQGSFVHGHDFVNGDGDPTDDHGHGTLVAGVVAARANNGLGGVGACSGCSLMPVKVIAGNGSGTASDIAAGIRWAADNGADVINMSFTLSGPDDGIRDAIEHAQRLGVLVVAAAGNSGTADVTFPAAYAGVVSVAGSDPSDARYDWSSFGGWVHVAAPGCSVSTAAGAAYGEFCGTSSATAFVSGLAGLARSLVSDRPSGEIFEKLGSSAAPVDGFVRAGRVDADALLTSLRPSGSKSFSAAVPAESDRRE